MRRWARALLAVAALLPPGLALPVLPAAAQGSANMIGAQRMAARNPCRPPLKYAAGACVASCPAGFRDNGRTCSYRNESR